MKSFSQENLSTTFTFSTNEIHNIIFECLDNLNNCVDSLLLPEGSVIATMEIPCQSNHSVICQLHVVGEVKIEFKGELYTSLEDFPDELIQAIKNNEEKESYFIHNNNWFELLYSLYDSDGNLIVEDADVWESPIISVETLRTELLDALILFSNHYRYQVV